MLTTEAISRTAAITGVGSSVRPAAAGPSTTRRETQNTAPRRCVAVTVALSEPANSAELDWPETVAAMLRLMFNDTTVTVIDAWRADV